MESLGRRERSALRLPSFCAGRRDVLKLCCGGLLTALLPGMDVRAARERGKARPKSLITLWLAGGPSQLETWDPHPGTKAGGPTKSIPTRLPNVRIAEFYPQTAEQLDALNVIRSLVSKEGDHARGAYYTKTGYRPDPTVVHPSVGAIASFALPDETLEIPAHVSLGVGPHPARGGYLGSEYDAFRVVDPGGGLTNLRAPVAERRQERRLAGLDVVSQTFAARRKLQTEQSRHQQTIQRALTMMSSEQLRAFDLSDEPQAVQQAYGDHRFGRGCLVARRLIETGVRAVEVVLPGWDSHADNFEAHRRNGAILDPALASLMRDLRDRDLLESTVVLVLGEFGRTPRINPLEGRDHWPMGFSCLVGGGGLRRGVVIGETTSEESPAEPRDPAPIQDLYATILHTLGIDPAAEQITPIGRPLAWSSGRPIAQLLPES